MIIRLFRLARSVALWPIDFAASALYDYGLKTVEGLLATTEAFDNLAAAARNNIPTPAQPPYTGDDYKHAAAILNRTAELRTNPWLDYDQELGTHPAPNPRECQTCGYDEANHKREAHLYRPMDDHSFGHSLHDEETGDAR
jgi:hypothetical protein